MSVLFSGDFHANKYGEMKFINEESLRNKYHSLYDGINFHIILGDGGFKRPLKKRKYDTNYDPLARRGFPVLCVIGNGDPFLGMKNVKETDIGIGETVFQIDEKPFVAYLKRGKAYTVDGIKFLVLGGALTPNRGKLVRNYSWWENEYWSEEEKRDVFKLLEKDSQFDLVISHTGPYRVNKVLFNNYKYLQEKLSDEVACLNDEIDKKIRFREWWCGHWHRDCTYYDETTGCVYEYLYKYTRLLNKTGNDITLSCEWGLNLREQ